MKKVVIDTNVLLVSISSKSKYHWIFESLLRTDFILCVNNEILSEYQEIIERKMGSRSGEITLNLIENLPNIYYSNSYFRFNLLQDPDDNKFVDCAISSNADFLVTHDTDFDILKEINFPKVNVLNSDEFKAELLTGRK